MDLLIFIALIAGLATVVSDRAQKLNRNPVGWGLAACLFSPLVVWLVLEICSWKPEKS